METAEAVRPVSSGEYADADTQIPSGLIGGCGSAPSFRRSHPDEQCVEGEMQRTEWKPLHESDADIGADGKLRIVFRQTPNEGQAHIACYYQYQTTNDEFACTPLSVHLPERNREMPSPTAIAV